jgi:predicted MPP superfamily phosphohydrolase
VLAAGAAAVGLGLDAFLVEPHRLELVRRTLPLENLPAGLAGRTLLQVSDIHVGPEVSSRYLVDSFIAAQRLEPDFVAFTGDFVSYRSAHDVAELARVLRAFPRGRLGTVASLGNHDYGRSWRQMDVANQVARVAGDAGLHVLRNEVVTIAGLQLAGLADFWSPEFGPAGGVQTPGLMTPDLPKVRADAGDARLAIAGIVGGRPTVILSHNPDVQDEPLWGGVRGWVLAGHTHGGQVKPPFLPPPVLPVRNKRYSSGVFEVGPGRSMYVSRGVGHLHHVRFNVRPEITLFTLAKA